MLLALFLFMRYTVNGMAVRPPLYLQQAAEIIVEALVGVMCGVAQVQPGKKGGGMAVAAAAGRAWGRG